MIAKNIKILLGISLLIVMGVLILSSFTTPEEDIIGTWISEEDSNSEWVFTTDGICYWNYTGEESEVFTYTISTTSPQCRQEVKTGGSEDYYLKLIDEDNAEYCYEILGIDDDSLSLSSIGLGVKYFYFLKQ